MSLAEIYFPTDLRMVMDKVFNFEDKTPLKDKSVGDKNQTPNFNFRMID